MGVGSIGERLLPYDECDTFLSTDNGVTWKMVRLDAHKYEFGDSGSVLVMINDEDSSDTVVYSTNLGKDWCVSHASYRIFDTHLRFLVQANVQARYQGPS